MSLPLVFQALFLGILALSMAAGCSQEPRASHKPAQPGEGPEISISGSGTPIPLFRRLVEAYREVAPSARVQLLPGTSTGGGVEGVRSGALQIGICSRALKPEEKALGLAYHLLAYDLIVFAAHPSAGISQLSPEAIRGIYGGKTTRWSQVGGVDRDILLLDRDEGESIKMILREGFFGPQFAISPSATVFLHAADMAEGLRSTPFSIGFAGRGELRTLGLNLTVVPPLGEWPQRDAVLSGAHPLALPVGIVSSAAPAPEVLRFVQFLRGEKGRSLMDALGYFPPRRGAG